MKLKRFTAMLLCVLLLGALPVAVSAESTDSMQTVSKAYTLRIDETHGAIETVPSTPAFWEYPILRAGEEYTEGTLVLCNGSEYAVSMELSEVMLPYGDAAKLSYLDHLQLTVSEGDTVIYDDTYAHVNDAEGGLKIAFGAMAPGEEHIYTIKLRCHYDYAGDPYADASQVAWMFIASTQTMTYEESQGLPLWALIVVIVFAVMIAVILLIMIIRAIVSAANRKQAAVGTESANSQHADYADGTDAESEKRD